MKRFNYESIYEHLITNGWDSTYTTWFLYREKGSSEAPSDDVESSNLSNEWEHHDACRVAEDFTNQVEWSQWDQVTWNQEDQVAQDEEPDVNVDFNEEQEEDDSAQVDNEVLFGEDKTPPLYSGCTNYTRFSATMALYQYKARHGLSNNGFNELLEILIGMLPYDNTLLVSLWKVKEMLKENELHYEKIDACVKDCCLFWKENDALDACPKCHSS
ncbi:hypothetical protein Scep_007013 [Stephania cephalantha]|uniref:Transposase n=1 Tax=Stephania cephalantha TaxID=152367 RepID=A0AAP0PPL3_9MAGN